MAADTVARFTASLIDIGGVKSTALSHLYIDGATTVTLLGTALKAWQDAVDGISDAQILTSEAAILPGLSGTLKDAPVDGNEIWEVGNFSFLQGAGPYHYGQSIPAIAKTLVVGHEINESDALVVAFKTLMLGAVAGGHYSGLNRETLTALSSSFRGLRKHRRALRAQSARTP